VARILVIDDSPVVLDAIAQLLGSRGHEVVTAENAVDGLGLVARESFTLVVADVRMPGMDGVQMLTAIRAWMPALPVIMLSSARDTKVVLRAIQEGAFDYLIKDDGLEELVSAVDRAIRQLSLAQGNRRLVDPKRGVKSSPSKRR
jgi:DNA-binding NtrC family response regulator